MFKHASGEILIPFLGLNSRKTLNAVKVKTIKGAYEGLMNSKQASLEHTKPKWLVTSMIQELETSYETLALVSPSSSKPLVEASIPSV